MIIVPIMMLIMIAPLCLNGDSMSGQDADPTMAILPVFIGIMAFIMLMIFIGSRKDVAKYTRNDVHGLLRSDEEVDRFDQQMSQAPLMEVEIAAESTVFLTEDFVGEKFMSEGNLLYRFMRRSDIASFHYTKTSGTGANPLRASYFFDIRNAQNKVIFNGIAETGEKLAKLEAFLKIAQPEMK